MSLVANKGFSEEWRESELYNENGGGVVDTR